MRETRQSWLAGSLAMLALTVGQRAMGLISVMILARLLDVRGLGAYTFTQSVAQTFAGWARVGLDAGTHIALAGTTDHDRAARIIGQALTVALVIAGAGAGALVACADVIAEQLFQAPDLASFVVPAAVAFAGLTLFGVIYAVHAGLGTFAAYARTSMRGALSALVLGAAGAGVAGPLGAAWGLAAGQVITTALAAVAMRRVLHEREMGLRLAKPGREIVDVIARGLPFFAGVIVVLPADFIGLTLLARVGGVDALGELRVTQAIMSVASTVPSAMMGPIMTFLASEYASGRGESQVRRQIKFLWVLSLLIAVVLAGVWPIAVSVIAANAFPQASEVGDLALATFVPAMLLSVLTAAILARGRSAFALLTLGALQALAFIAAVYLLVPRFGLAGYLAAQTFGFCVASGAAAIAWGSFAAPGGRVALLGAMTIGLFAALALDLTHPLEFTPRFVAAMIGTLAIATLSYIAILTGGERAALVAALARVRRRLARVSPNTSA